MEIRGQTQIHTILHTSQRQRFSWPERVVVFMQYLFASDLCATFGMLQDNPVEICTATLQSSWLAWNSAGGTFSVSAIDMNLAQRLTS